MVLIVTGGVGMMGRETVRSLADRGLEIRVIDTRVKRSGRFGQIQMVKANVSRLPVNSKILSDAEGLIHLAAVSRVPYAEKYPFECVNSNVGGTARLLELASNARHPPWVIHASSREVYGEPQAIPVSEVAPIRPINLYGATKAISERLVENYAKSERIPAVILRFSNVYGSTNDYRDRVVPRFVINALNSRPLNIYNGAKLLDFTHVEDATRAILFSVDRLERSQGSMRTLVANIASGRGTTLRQLARIVKRAAGSNSAIRETESHEYDVMRYVGNPANARRYLKFRTNVSVGQGIAKTVELFRAR